MMTLADREALVAIIAALPNQQATVVSLRVEHELRDQEIVRALGIPMDQVIALYDAALAAIPQRFHAAMQSMLPVPDLLSCMPLDVPPPAAKG